MNIEPFRWTTPIRSRTLQILLYVALWLPGCDRGEGSSPPQRVLSDAWSDFRLGEFSGAGRKFDRVISDSGANNTAWRLEATYGSACVAGMGADANEAAAKALYQRIVREAPASPWAAWSRLAMVRLQQQCHGTDSPVARQELLDAYQAVETDYPGTAAADEAFVNFQAVRLISLDADDARHVAAEITRYLEQGKTAFSSALHDLRSVAYRLCGQHRQALDDAVASIETRELDPENPSPVDAGKLYAIGVRAQFDVGDFATARRFYNQFLEQYPTDVRAFTVGLLMKDMDKVESALKQSANAPTMREWE